jgi:hypothetical protein
MSTNVSDRFWFEAVEEKEKKKEDYSLAVPGMHEVGISS